MEEPQVPIVRTSRRKQSELLAEAVRLTGRLPEHQPQAMLDHLRMHNPRQHDQSRFGDLPLAHTLHRAALHHHCDERAFSWEHL